MSLLVSLAALLTATAAAVPKTYTLSAVIPEHGSIGSEYFSCTPRGEDCSAQVPAGLARQLDAYAEEGYVFVAWGGACSGQRTSSCVLEFTQDLQVSATFKLKADAPPPEPTPQEPAPRDPAPPQGPDQPIPRDPAPPADPAKRDPAPPADPAKPAPRDPAPNPAPDQRLPRDPAPSEDPDEPAPREPTPPRSPTRSKPNLLLNPGFETGDASHWDAWPATGGRLGVGSWQPHRGTFSAYQVSDTVLFQHFASQTMALANGRYQASCWIRGQALYGFNLLAKGYRRLLPSLQTIAIVSSEDPNIYKKTVISPIAVDSGSLTIGIWVSGNGSTDWTQFDDCVVEAL